jgi:hypothetical protein
MTATETMLPRIAGRNVTVLVDQAGGYRVRVSRGFVFKRRDQWSATDREVDALEQTLLTYLTKANQRGRVVMKMDFYGNQWFVVRRALLWRQVIRLPQDRLMRVAAALQLS